MCVIAIYQCIPAHKGALSVSKPHICLVESDPIACRTMQTILSDAGYEISSWLHAEDFKTQFQALHFDLLLTNYVRPLQDGKTLLEWVRSHDRYIELMLATTNATLDSVITAMRQQAADYIVTPIADEDLVNYVGRAIARRTARMQRRMKLFEMSQILQDMAEDEGMLLYPEPKSLPVNAVAEGYQVGPWRIEPKRFRVTYYGKTIALSQSEYNLLSYLAAHAEQVISPQTITRDVMGFECGPYEARDLVKARVWALRRKIEADPKKPRYLLSVRGFGYKLTNQGADQGNTRKYRYSRQDPNTYNYDDEAAL